jgi:hypothetical protein
LNQETLIRHAGNMTQDALAESAVLFSTADCADMPSLHELEPLFKRRLGVLYDILAMPAKAHLIAILDPAHSSWSKLIRLTNLSRVKLSRRTS